MSAIFVFSRWSFLQCWTAWVSELDLLKWPCPPSSPPPCSSVDVASPQSFAERCCPLRPGLDSFPGAVRVFFQVRGTRFVEKSGTGITLTETRWVLSIFTLLTAKNSPADFLWSWELRGWGTLFSASSGSCVFSLKLKDLKMSSTNSKNSWRVYGHIDKRLRRLLLSLVFSMLTS